MAETQLDFIVDNLYHLKMDYGRPADLYKSTSVENITTGRKTITRRVVHIQKLLMFPAIEDHTTKYNQSYLRSDRLFSYGGYIQTAKKIAILDVVDVPSDFEVRKDDYLIVEERLRKRRYEIKGLQEYEDSTAYILELAETEGVELAQVVELKASSILSLSQEITIG